MRFADLGPGAKVSAVNTVIEHLNDGRPRLSLPSSTWLERMEHACCAGVFGQAYLELQELWLAYLARLSAAEQAELERRLAEFRRLLRVAPPWATRNGDLLVAALDEVLEKGRLA